MPRPLLFGAQLRSEPKEHPRRNRTPTLHNGLDDHLAKLKPSLNKFLWFSHKYGTIKQMRTTVDIPDPVYRRLKSRAASEGSSAKELILRAVQLILKDSPRKSRKRVKLPIIKSKQPGTLELDNDRIFEIISFP